MLSQVASPKFSKFLTQKHFVIEKYKGKNINDITSKQKTKLHLVCTYFLNY